MSASPDQKTGKQALPRNPMFVRLYAGAVHVVDNETTAGYQIDAVGDEALDPYLSVPPQYRRIGEGPTDPIANLLGIVKTRCGREIARNVGGQDASGTFIATFADDDLCRACYATVRPEESSRLFEHATEIEA